MGFQSILMGLIAELLVRTYHESQGKTTYTIRKALNIRPDELVEGAVDAHPGIFA